VSYCRQKCEAPAGKNSCRNEDSPARSLFFLAAFPFPAGGGGGKGGGAVTKREGQK